MPVRRPLLTRHHWKRRETRARRRWRRQYSARRQDRRRRKQKRRKMKRWKWWASCSSYCYKYLTVFCIVCLHVTKKMGCEGVIKIVPYSNELLLLPIIRGIGCRAVTFNFLLCHFDVVVCTCVRPLQYWIKLVNIIIRYICLEILIVQILTGFVTLVSWNHFALLPCWVAGCHTCIPFFPVCNMFTCHQWHSSSLWYIFCSVDC